MSAPTYSPQPVQARNGMGVTALVLGIIGAVIGLIPLFGLGAIILGILAVVFGLVGFSRARKGAATNRKMSLIGAILGVIALALGIWGMVILGQAVSKIGTDLHNLDTSISNMPTPTFPPAPTP